MVRLGVVYKVLGLKVILLKGIDYMKCFFVNGLILSLFGFSWGRIFFWVLFFVIELWINFFKFVIL